MPPNGVRYLRVGGRGQGLGAGKTRSQKILENAAESHTSGVSMSAQSERGWDCGRARFWIHSVC